MAARYKDWREGRRFRAYELQQQDWGVTAVARALDVSTEPYSTLLYRPKRGYHAM